MFGISNISYFPNTHRTHTDRDMSSHVAGIPRMYGHYLDFPAVRNESNCILSEHTQNTTVLFVTYVTTGEEGAGRREPQPSEETDQMSGNDFASNCGRVNIKTKAVRVGRFSCILQRSPCCLSYVRRKRKPSGRRPSPVISSQSMCLGHPHSTEAAARGCHVG